MKTLSLIEKAFFLKKIPIFNDLDLDLLLAIGEKMTQDSYDPGEKIFDPKQRANRMYFIVQGTVEILDPNGLPICELNPEDFFGDESLLNEKPRQYYALCKAPSLFLTLSRAHLLTILSECPSVSLSLLQQYAQNRSNRFKKEEIS